jgi:hypothetical protein
MLFGSHFCPFSPVFISVETLATGQIAVHLPGKMLNSAKRTYRAHIRMSEVAQKFLLETLYFCATVVHLNKPPFTLLALSPRHHLCFTFHRLLLSGQKQRMQYIGKEN